MIFPWYRVKLLKIRSFTIWRARKFHRVRRLLKKAFISTSYLIRWQGNRHKDATAVGISDSFATQSKSWSAHAHFTKADQIFVRNKEETLRHVLEHSKQNGRYELSLKIIFANMDETAVYFEAK